MGTPLSKGLRKVTAQVAGGLTWRAFSGIKEGVPHRQRYLFICTNRREDGNPKGSCAQQGSEELVKLFKAALVKRGVAGALRACSSSCLDLCEVAAAVVQEPEHVVYGKVTPEDVPEIVDAMVSGNIVHRLVVKADG